MLRKLFHSQAKGAYAENDDDYTLVTDTDGKQSVEHEWSHVDVYNTGNVDKGKTSVSTDEFLAGSAYEGIKAKLRHLLGR